MDGRPFGVALVAAPDCLFRGTTSALGWQAESAWRKQQHVRDRSKHSMLFCRAAIPAAVVAFGPPLGPALQDSTMVGRNATE